jgi:hypothetical protein
VIQEIDERAARILVVHQLEHGGAHLLDSPFLPAAAQGRCSMSSTR